MDTNQHEFYPQNTQNTPKCLAAGPTITKGFNDKNKTLIVNDANGSGGSAVVIVARRQRMSCDKSSRK